MKWFVSILLVAVVTGCGMSAIPASNECADVDGCLADDGGSTSDAERTDGDPSPVRPVTQIEEETEDDPAIFEPDFVDPTPSPVRVIDPFPFDSSGPPLVVSPGSSWFYGAYVDQMLLDLFNPYGSQSTESYLQRLCLDSDLPETYCRRRYGP